MGRVWRATDEMLDRPVAVKEMRIDGLDPEDTRTRRERTLREARATARIDHPNVVRVYDVVDEGERLWIVMELVAGRSLERIMAEDGPLGLAEAARIGLGLVAALRQVHAGGVLHRDIKPGNVIVETGARGRVVLTDFGIAAIQDAKALTMVGMLVGSPDYMAPERVSGRPQGPPSDVWSLGATLCAALGGRSPFSRDTTLATLHAVLYEEPELPATAGALRAVLAALLEKEPSVRPGLEDVETALYPVAYPEPTPTVAVGGGGAEPEGDAGPQDEAEYVSEPGPGPEPDARAVSGDVSDSVQALDMPTPPLPWVAPRESRTPALLQTPPVGKPEQETEPEPSPDRAATSAASSASTEAASSASTEAASSASTEAASEVRSEVRSETPAGRPGVAGAHLTGRVTAARAEAVTEERRPGGGQGPVGMPQGELPGPAVPSAPRRGRRRTGLVAAAGVLTAGAVVAVVLTTASGSPGDKHAGTSAGPSAVSSGPGDSPSPTVEGTSRPQSLPPGTHQEAGGYAWATPEGWRRDVKTGAEVHYTSPDGKQELVAKSSLARGDLMETWQTSEQNAHQGRDYRKIRLAETTFRGHPAVVWEYTFTLDGVSWHARLLGFNAQGKSYQINTWYQPDMEAEALRTYNKVKDGFVLL
ncbi:protein kinase [Streptomyces sp. HUAS ZL42]|uniref:protein kinase domain-containing protein n=1 Tax=Streptomyces sp. HUAS ZL42 TaxID=3231715 RepID=UPI00345E9553